MVEQGIKKYCERRNAPGRGVANSHRSTASRITVVDRRYHEDFMIRVRSKPRPEVSTNEHSQLMIKPRGDTRNDTLQVSVDTINLAEIHEMTPDKS